MTMIRVVGLDTVIRKFAKVQGEQLRIVVDHGLNQGIQKTLLPAIRNAAPVSGRARNRFGKHESPGGLKKSVKSKPMRRRPNEMAAYKVGPTAWYAAWVVKGTRPHKLTPRQGKAMRLMSTAGLIYRKEIDHPGTRANPFVGRAAAAAAPSLEDILLQDILKAWTKTR